MSSDFDRGLSADFQALLKTGVARPLWDRWRSDGLDVRLRDEYLNVYEHGASIAKLTLGRRVGPRLVIHHKYVGDGRLGSRPGRRLGRDYLRWDLDHAVVRAWLDELPEIRERARTFAGPEGEWEDRVVRDNHWLLDRQVQVPTTGSKADLVGLSSVDGRPTLVVLELKAGLNNDIQRSPQQLSRYLDILAPSGGLRADVARSYATVAGQLRALGFPAPDPAPIEPGMLVVGCLVLCEYNGRSRLLGRAQDLAATLPHPLYLKLLDGSSELGLPQDWSRLAAR